MSNASNLSTLANVLDDGSDGQFLKSTGSGGVAFDTVAAGAVVYATADLLPLSGNSAGDMAYVTATNRFYINNGSGWYSVSLVNTNPNITSVQDAGSNTTPFTLATDGTATVITVTAADPEDIPLTYGYSVTSGSLNGSTVAQGTGSNTNVFTVTPHASQDATFTLTFTASDGINQATSANEFSLSFVTVVTDSNHTTLLATATGTSDNNNITDSSSNSYSITVTGDAYAGTFSPYRSGGYSTHFETQTSRYYTNSSSDFDIGGTGDWSYEAWIYVDNQTWPTYPRAFGLGPYFNDPKTFGILLKDPDNSNAITVYWDDAAGQSRKLLSTTTFSQGVWHHLATCRSGNNIALFLDGTRIAHNGSYTSAIDAGNTWLYVGHTGFNVEGFQGYVRDVRFINGSHPYDASDSSITVPTEPLTKTANTKFLSSTLPYLTDISDTGHSLTVSSNVSTKPFSPYDYNEYDATDHGGSVHFVGNLDNISVAGSSDFAPSTSQFTIKLWYYPKVQSTGTTYIVRQGTSTSTVGYWAIAHYSSGRIRRMENVGGSFSGTYSANNVIKIGQWNYIEFYQNGASTGEIKVNGVSVLTGANYVGNTDNLQFGSSTASDADLFISDVQIVKGSDGRESSVPIAPMSTDTNSKLHIKGTDASIIDKSQGANLKLFGNTTGSTGQVRPNAWANTKTMYFDGSGDYLTLPQILLGSGNFTIEAWTYLESRATTYPAIFSNYSSFSAGSLGLFAGHGSSTTTNYQVAHNGSGFPAINAGTVSYDQWVHLALVRNNGTITLYKDGTSIGSFTSSADLSGVGSNFYIGAAGDGISTSYIDGYIQDFRITNGLARYTANFTPPSAPLEG